MATLRKPQLKGLKEYLSALDNATGRELANKVIDPILRGVAEETRRTARTKYLSGKALDVRSGDLRRSVDVSFSHLPKRVVIGSDNTAGVVWEQGRKQQRARKWLRPALEDELKDLEAKIARRWEGRFRP